MRLGVQTKSQLRELHCSRSIRKQLTQGRHGVFCIPFLSCEILQLDPENLHFDVPQDDSDVESTQSLFITLSV